MKVISNENFIKLTASKKWKISQSYEIFENTTWTSIKSEYDQRLESHDVINGAVIVLSTFGDIEIIYSRGFHYTSNKPSEIHLSDEDVKDCERWILDGVLLEDEMGKRVDFDELVNIMPEKFHAIDEDKLRRDICHSIH